ncbi:MAG: hypothetical protein WAT39_00535 [Planctomycetota bacterium]
MLRARFYVHGVVVQAACYVGWPVDQDAAIVALVMTLRRAGIDSDLIGQVVCATRRSEAWPALTNIGGRPSITDRTAHAGLNYSDGGAEPDAIELVLAMRRRS